MALELPLGTKVLSITPSGASAWVQTVRIDTELADGSQRVFFMKASLKIIVKICSYHETSEYRAG